MTLAHNAIMGPEAALREPLVQRILMRVLDRLDAQPAIERTNPIRINLDPEMAPEIHGADSLASRAVAWASIDGVVAAEWASLDYRKHRKQGSRDERGPYLDFQWSTELESLMRQNLGRPRKATSYALQWAALLAQAALPLSEDAVAKLGGMPIEISGRAIEEVFSRFLSIRDLAQQSFLLREVSSRVFWGLSKVLDGRAGAVAALLNCDECPFPEQPIVLNVHVTTEPKAFLFIENYVAFERLKNRNDLSDMALVFSSGFRGAAARLRAVGGCSVYYSRQSAPEAMVIFEQILMSEADMPTFFWGDLDYSGMAILVSLRTTFPSAQAWQQGYHPMLARLVNEDGHSPIESGKERQRVIEATGCQYADNYILPALKVHRKFLDQE